MSFQCSAEDNGDGSVNLIFRYDERRAMFWINCCFVDRVDLCKNIRELLNGAKEAKHGEFVDVHLKDGGLSFSCFCGELTIMHEDFGLRTQKQCHMRVPFDACVEDLEALCEELEEYLGLPSPPLEKKQEMIVEETVNEDTVENKECFGVEI
nr:adenosylmethionine-8-amino-7-oxononanoate aminotransferase [Marseillevirus cajuinensis]